MANSVLYGVMNSKDLAANLTPQNVIITIDRDLVIGAVQETVDQHNQEINELRALFADPTTDYSLFYQGYVGNDLQEGDENARPLPVKGISRYSVGFPIRIGTTGWGANYTTLNQMTLADFSDRTDQMLLGDVNWNRKWTLGTLLFDGNNGTPGVSNGLAAGTAPYVFTDTKYGAISVYGLANGDTTTYNKFGSQLAATDNHYTAQNGAISDTSGQNPFPTIEAALLEHPENQGPLLSLIDPALATSVKALAGFTAATNIIDARTRILATPGSTTPTFAGADLPQLPASAQIIGSYDRTYIATWRTVPTNIIITLNLGGPKPLLFRQFPQAALQGFGPVGFFNPNRRQVGDNFPYFNETWYRAGGFGGYNRVGAHVHQVGSSTTYAMPSSYYPLFGRTS
jgi:hypothetical protein